MVSPERVTKVPDEDGSDCPILSTQEIDHEVLTVGEVEAEPVPTGLVWGELI